MRIYGGYVLEGPAGLDLPAPGPDGEHQGSVTMKHRPHSCLMIGLVAAGGLLFLTGNAGGPLLLLWPLACLALMVWGMGGMVRSAPVSTDHTHDFGLTHAPT